jgi:hypothetical protein
MTNIAGSFQHFLTSPGLKVAALKGDWGTGKTFFWNKFLRDNRAKLTFRAYSYVSLFGVSNIEEVRRQIFTNFEVLNNRSMTKHLGKLKPLSNILKSVEIPYLNSTSAISSYVERKAVDNFLVCFDDLERKEAGISAASLLGLVSQLKEEQNCKIILVYNESELDKASQDEIAEYREKVIDLELKYQPTIKNNLAIIWPQGVPAEVEAAFTAVGLNNIRVMQRVQWALKYFEPTITGKFPLLWSSLQVRVTSLVIIHHAFAEVLSLDEAISTNHYARLFSKDTDEEPRIKEGFGLLEKLGYLPDKCDQVVVDYIKNGYVNWDEYKDLLASAAEKSKFDTVNAEHRALWQTFHHGFIKNQAEFISEHLAFLHEHTDELRLADVWASVNFLKELDPECKADGLLDAAIDRFVESADSTDASYLFRMGLPKEIIEKIEPRLTAKQTPKSIKDLFLLLTHSGGWNPSDLKYFTHFTPDQIYEWITSETTVDVVGVLKEFLSRFSSDPQASDSTAKVKAAIARVKARSPFDARRVSLIEKD